MKKHILYFLLAGNLLTACNEGDFLSEDPKDFMSTENAYITETDFDMAVNEFYYRVRLEYYGSNENRPFDYVYGTDLVYDGEPGGTERHKNIIAAYQPDGNIAKDHWERNYKIISNANAIINRLASRPFTEDVKTQFKAKALFFRGMAYRTLGYLYGGVPIVLEELTTPKTDFVRSTKEQTLGQAIEDVKFAAENLKDIKDVRDGEVSSAAAYHLLAELYLAVGKYAEARDAATKVIDNPALELMQTRFGSRKDETPGDVYWDLFRMNNQNRKAGNTEGIWVIQYEVDLPGGGGSTTTAKTSGNYNWERNFAPMVRDVRLKDADGKYHNAFEWPMSDYTGGRGIGWGISTHHYSNTVWESDFNNDIRNANHNFVRKFKVTKKEFIDKFGIDVIDIDNPPAGLEGPGNNPAIPGRALYAYQSKITTPGNHPDPLYENKATGKLKSSAGATYTDQYMFRLAETYLLRAEAYLGLNDKGKAAADINVVRERSKAKPVAAADVDLDYILDERIRELGIEEKRRLTLVRTGTWFERVKKYNPDLKDAVEEKFALWPIPQSVIEANTDAKMDNNPGYE